MIKSSFLLIIFLSILLYSCSQEQDVTMQPPAIDFSTPENLIKSIWEYQRWDYTASNEYSCKWLAKNTVPQEKKRIENLKKYFKKGFEGIIIGKVEFVNNTRAIVFTIDSLNEYILPNEKLISSKVKYILTKEAGKWLVEDIMTPCMYCNGTGRVIDYDTWDRQKRKGTAPIKICMVCDSACWRSNYFDKLNNE